MDEHIKIKEAKVEDAEIILQYLEAFQKENAHAVISHEEFPTLEQEQELIESKKEGEGEIFICLSKRKVVGMVGVDRKNHPQLRHSCEFGIGVLKAYRYKDVGRILLMNVEEWAKANGLRRIELSVLSNDPGAIMMYKKFGYAQEGKRTGSIEIEGKYLDVIEMVKVLKKR